MSENFSTIILGLGSLILGVVFVSYGLANLMANRKKENNKKSSKDYEDMRLIAWHEVGHTIYAKKMNLDFIDVTIIPSVSRDEVTFGFTQVDLSANKLKVEKKKDIEGGIHLLLAGRVGELLFTKDEQELSTGCICDIEEANELIYEYVNVYGFSKEFNMTSPKELSQEDNPELLRIYTKLMNHFYDETTDYLKEHQLLMEMMVDELVKKKTLDNEEVEEIIKKYEDKYNKKNSMM